MCTYRAGQITSTLVGGQWCVRVVLLCGVLVLGTGIVPALPPTNPDGPTVICPPGAEVSGGFRVEGFLLIGEEVTVVASTVKIVATHPDPLIDCALTVFPLNSFSWQLVARPAGSNTVLSGGSTLMPTLTPDVAGDYTVRFSACSSGCTVTLGDGGMLTAPPFSHDVKFTAVDEYAIPPETEPLLPAMSGTPPLPASALSGHCDFGASVLSPAWLAVEPWAGPEDYETVEGHVIESRTSNKDSFLNHDSLDFLSFVETDPPYKRLHREQQDDLEIEWEYRAYPERYRPTRSDRVSAVGYWITDCSHGNKTEIHPPVLMAAHRPRAIRIPSSQGYGANVYVPGIATDLYLGRDAGEATSNCSQTALHQPGIIDGFFDCLPQDPGPGLPGYPANPINAIYRFHIYLPRDPQEIVGAIQPVPPVPLFRTVYARPGDEAVTAPDPIIRVCPDECEGANENDPTYLEVTLDLSDFTGDAYSRRIEAAWVYPSPNNWGMRTWKIKLHHLDIEDDGDWEPFNDGDWRMWFNTNNTDGEWTKLMECSGCIEEGIEDFGGVPWETGDVTQDRRLGPNLHLFPGQKIWIHTSGFDNDWIFKDPIGRVTALHEQVAHVFNYRTRFCGDCLPYTMRYETIERTPIDNAGLTAAGQALHEAYLITPPDLTGQISLPERELRGWQHPSEEPSTGTEPVQLDGQHYFKQQGIEPNTLHDATLEEFQTLLAVAQEHYPEQLAQAMTELREEVDLANQQEVNDLSGDLSLLNESMPPELWQEYFADLPVVDNCPELYNPAQLDEDEDGAGDDCDCAPQDPNTSPNLPEENDGLDNNCNGQVDEIAATTRFSPNSTGPATPLPQFEWSPQGEADLYQVVRADRADLSGACTLVTTPETRWGDDAVPEEGQVLFYAVRAVEPLAGSLGVDSAGQGRLPACSSTDHVFTFHDSSQQDLRPDSLAKFFAALPSANTNFIKFQIRDEFSHVPRATAWCAERADWYISEYLTHSRFSFTSFSGAWNKWSRDSQTGDGWLGPDTAGYPNHFGGACQGIFSWCTEAGLGGLPTRSIRPGNSACELSYPLWGSCFNGAWRLTVQLGADRESVCGF